MQLAAAEKKKAAGAEWCRTFAVVLGEEEEVTEARDVQRCSSSRGERESRRRNAGEETVSSKKRAERALCVRDWSHQELSPYCHPPPQESLKPVS